MKTDPQMAVQVCNMTKSYGKVRALRSLNLDIARGEIFAILGPNGAGKSTAIEILEGQRKRDGGDVSVLGHDPGTAGRSWRSRIGIVLQETSDFGMLTVAETVQMFAKCYGSARTCAELLDLVGLAANARCRVRTLSGGQRRRLDVALGIIGYPELLFLDEPTTGFDPEARRAFWDLIRLLASDGTTIVLTTHYLEEAAALADRVAVIADGQLMALNSPALLTAHIASAATVTWMQDGVAQIHRTERPTELIRRLSAEGMELTQLTVTRPSLEEAYLMLIERDHT